MTFLTSTPSTAAERFVLVVHEVEARLGPAVAATYMQTRNFALGGLKPIDLLTSEEGTQQVLAEVSTHADFGPL